MNLELQIPVPPQAAAPFGEIRFLRLPARDLFARRAERLLTLSEGHPLGEYLRFLALIASAQDKALQRVPSLAVPSPDEQALCREHVMPLLGARSLPRNSAWRDALATILWQTGSAALPQAAQEVIAELSWASTAVLEEKAGLILDGDLLNVAPRELPFVAAALQVYWVHLASSLGEDAFGRPHETGACPVCGSSPVAGVVLSGGADQGLRYLSCSLCSSQWHAVRLTCSSCAGTAGLSYYTLEGSNGAVKAESCTDCGSYLKLLYLEKDAGMEATADDLATLTLDMLMEHEGKARSGPNLFFHPSS